MKVRLYYPDVELQLGVVVMLSKLQSHYVANVLCLKDGANIFLFNSKGEFCCVLSFLSKISCACIPIAIDMLPHGESSPRVTLFCAIVKPDIMKEIVMSATEMGVSVIQPILTQHIATSIVNIAKLELVAVSSTEQSRRLSPPEIRKPISIQELVLLFDGLLLLANENEIFVKKNCFLLNYDLSIRDIGCIVGPEGGFTDNEVDFLLSNNAISVSLGDTILRSKTAVVAITQIAKMIACSQHF